MITYCANPVRAALPAFNSGGLAMIVTPNQGNKLPAGIGWCADNGCGPTKTGPVGSGYPGDGRYLAWLAGMADKAADCLFATAPDVLGDAAATLERSAPMLPAIRELGYKVALVAQDGLEELDVPWDSFDVLFLGGSTEWKLGEAAERLTREARARGKGVHMGRVNSRKRLRIAASWGCTSADGTYLTFGPEKNLPKLLGWLDELQADETAAARVQLVALLRSAPRTRRPEWDELTRDATAEAVRCARIWAS